MISVITIARNINTNINNLLDGIALGDVMPREVIIIDALGDLKIEKEYNFFIKIQQLPHHIQIQSGLSLGSARNLGARLAWGEDLIFLDETCIPSSTFIGKMEEHLLCASGVIMGEPRYLTETINELSAELNLMERSFYHKDRPELTKQLTPCFDPEMFWSLCFGIKKDLFLNLGGFDETFTLNETEDIDFAFTIEKKNVDFYLSKNTVYHMGQMENASPNDIEAIVSDSNKFFKKWGEWPFKELLERFKKEGSIDWSESQKNPVTIPRDSDGKFTKIFKEELVIGK